MPSPTGLDDFDWHHWYATRGLPVPPEVQAGQPPPGVQQVGAPPAAGEMQMAPTPPPPAQPSEGNARLQAFAQFNAGSQGGGFQQPGHVLSIQNGPQQEEYAFNKAGPGGTAYAARTPQEANLPWTQAGSRPITPGVNTVPFQGYGPGTPTGPTGAANPLADPFYQQLMAGVPSTPRYGGVLGGGWSNDKDPHQLKMAMDFYSQAKQHELGQGQLELARESMREKYDPRNLALSTFSKVVDAHLQRNAGQINPEQLAGEVSAAIGAAYAASQTLHPPGVTGSYPVSQAGSAAGAPGVSIPGGSPPAAYETAAAIERRNALGGRITDLLSTLNPATKKPEAGLSEIGRQLWLEDQARAGRGDIGYANRNKANILGLLQNRYSEDELLNYLYPNRMTSGGLGQAGEAGVAGGLAQAGAARALPRFLANKFGAAALGPPGQLVATAKLGSDLFSKERLKGLFGVGHSDEEKGRAALRALMGYDPNAVFFPSRVGG